MRPAVLIALIAGTALGIVSVLSDYALRNPWAMVGNLAGSWVLVAFAVGALANRGSITRGAGAGMLSLIVATLAYYIGTSIARGLVRPDRLIPGAAVWSAVGLIAGPAAGAAGAVWRERRFRGQSRWWYSAVATGILTVPLIAESLFLLVQVRGSDSTLGASAELVIGLVLPPVLLRSLRDSLAAYATTIALGAIAMPVLIIAMPPVYMLAGSGHL